MTSETLRLFVAVWPDDSARAWLRALDAQIAWPSGAAREVEAKRHLTLHFLGAVPLQALAELLPALQQPFAPFDVELGRVAMWPRGLVVVEPLQRAAPLHELHTALGAALQRHGQRVEARAYKPHVTLARRAAGAAWPQPAAPQRWCVSAYALVASAGGRYRNVALYAGGLLPRDEGRSRVP